MPDLLSFLLGILLLLLGGDSAVKACSGLAQRLGMSPFRAGLFLLAFATSLPELAVNLYAVADGRPVLALGNAVGSNVVNIGLTLAVAGLVAPLAIGMRATAIQIVLLLVATGAVLLFGLDGRLEAWEGGALVAGFVAMLWLLLQRGGAESAEVRAELEDYAMTQPGLGRNLLRLALGAALLFFGARWIVDAAPALGALLGLQELLTGLLLVAIGTALPEVAVAAIAARQGKGNVVAGQVLGACLFNLLFVLGAMALHAPVPIPASFVGFELPAAMAFALALYPLLGGDLRLDRREAALLLALFAGWVGLELWLAR
jgi:cation:H+ antiporter